MRQPLDDSFYLNQSETRDTEKQGETHQRIFIAGIGASAGGLEPLEKFFGAMPPDSGLAFVVIQHLSPDFKSLMDEILARVTPMPILICRSCFPKEARSPS
jgi:two-component system CheB/CheR fusion protein